MENLRKLQIRSPYYEPHEIIREDYILGRGSFGIVYKGKLTDGNEEIALKLLKKFNGDPIREFSDAHQKEIEVLLEARHKNIVKFLGVVRKSIVYYHNEEPFLCDFLIFEFMANGNARDYVRYTNSTEEILFEISYGIASGMAYLHENDIIHRDLAARNILIDAKHQAKISDFGLSRLIDKYHDHYTITETTIRPTRWIARECLEIGGKFSKCSDIWSFGVTLWEIWNKGETPYANMNNEEVKQAIVAGQNPISLEIPEGIPGGIKTLLEHIFVEEELRPHFARIKIILNDISIWKGNGNLGLEIWSDCQENQTRMEGQNSNSEENEEFFTATSLNFPQECAQAPSELNSSGIKIIDEYFVLNNDNVAILSSLKDNYTVKDLRCFNISAKKILEIIAKFKATQKLIFLHSWDLCPGKCEYFGSSPGEVSDDCIFKLPQRYTLENLEELQISNLEINTWDVNFWGKNLPALKKLDIHGCELRGDLVDRIITRLFTLKEISLYGNIPLLENCDVEGLLRSNSLNYIHLDTFYGRQVISGSFAPIGPDGKRFAKIKQNAEIKFILNFNGSWKMKMYKK